MKERINIAEILKECRVTTRLYCSMFGNCLLSTVSTDENSIHPIKIVSPNHNSIIHFTIDGIGFWLKNSNGSFNIYGDECLLFPSSDYRSWEGVKVEDGKLIIPETVHANKFYCYGDKERAKEIRDEFEKLGAIGIRRYEYNHDNLYYIDNVGCMNCIVEEKEQAEKLLISQGYNKLKLHYHPKDKELVWCYDDNDITKHILGFYDARNHGIFACDCKRRGARYDNYAPYKSEYPDWAKEALKYLED